MNLSNQELVNELKKRVKEGSLSMQVIADEVQTETSSLFSKMGTESKLILVGLVIAFALYICYTIKVTTPILPKGCEVEFECDPSDKIAIKIGENS